MNGCQLRVHPFLLGSLEVASLALKSDFHNIQSSSHTRIDLPDKPMCEGECVQCESVYVCEGECVQCECVCV